jgi:N-acetylneuraminic acid mutarotase
MLRLSWRCAWVLVWSCGWLTGCGDDGEPGQATGHATAGSLRIESGPPPRTRRNDATFRLTCSAPDCRVTCRLDQSPWTPCDGEVRYAGLADGTHVFEASLGEPATAVSHTWRVDTVAPEVTLRGGPAAPTRDMAVTFEFSCDEPPCSFACAIDGAAFGSCGSPLTLEALADGEHAFAVRASDEAGNTGPAAMHAWVIDTSGPLVELGSAPAALTRESSASFAFACDAAGCETDCQLDEGGFQPCRSPAVFAALAAGEHVFGVRGRDAAGNVGATTRHRWSIDLAAPDTSITAAPASPTNEASAVFGFESPDASAHFECSFDGAPFEPCSSGTTRASLAAGEHSFRVRAVDAAKNLDATPAEHRWLIDLTPPEASIVSGPATPTRESDATFELAASEAAVFACSLDGAEFVACDAQVRYEALSDGAHGLRVRATDRAGNVSAAPASHAWVIDLVAPGTHLTAAPEPLTSQREATFAFESDDASATFECSLDGAGFSRCASGGVLEALDSREHELLVRAVDPAGNVDPTPASHVWTVDFVPPDTAFALRQPSPTTQTSASFRVTSSESPASFECSLDGAPFSACASEVAYAGLGVGEHTLAVRARDALGQRDATPAVHTWNIVAGELAHLASLAPAMGAVEVPLVLQGTGFGATQGERYVTVGGQRAPVHSWSDTYVVVGVPAGLAAGEWPVVMEPLAVASGSYEVVPWVRQLAPSVVDRAGSVFVRGASLGTARGTARIGDREATVTSWSDTFVELKVSAEAAAGTQHVELVTARGEATNRVPLNVRAHDHWSASDDVPGVRSGHVAVWTGTELLVWGGFGGFSEPTATGGRYDPLLDTWKPMSRVGAPEPTWGATGVWTGSELLVWGGKAAASGRYDPVADRWRPVSPLDAPAERVLSSAVWTGRELLVWGGRMSRTNVSSAGGRYDPVSDTWRPLSAVGSPVVRGGASAVWTGRELLVWGGRVGDTQYRNDGGRYDPETDTWTPMSSAAAPAARFEQQAVWTGAELLVWGGQAQSGFLDSGGRYDPRSDTWSAMSATGAPAARVNHTAVWTGRELVVWGGGKGWFEGTQDGARYDPERDSWTPTSLLGAPAPREDHSAVWTGIEMIVWGGSYGHGGGRYDPARDTWTATDGAQVPMTVRDHVAVWTGSEMLLWGSGAGGRYDPATRSWQPLSTENAPAARVLHSAVWTGSELIVWGGRGNSFSAPFASGGRYDPRTDRWTALSTVGSPSPRSGHRAVWTGTEMLVWGGDDAAWTRPVEGGRYDPARDTWSPMTATFAPSGRADFSAVWTGREMIVWGGIALNQPLGDGARYDPAADAWVATSSLYAPSARGQHTAVWTGREMIVWGGKGNIHQSSGFRYDPAADRWLPIRFTGTPMARAEHSAVWTGREMIVWGGRYESRLLATGGRFDPATDTWTALSEREAPSGRTRHSAVWTGLEMIVWGGTPGLSESATTEGAIYRP